MIFSPNGLRKKRNVGMRGYGGVTDDEWFRFLAARSEVSTAEVNSWWPGAAGTRSGR
jgi:hypothetical protein